MQSNEGSSSSSSSSGSTSSESQVAVTDPAKMFNPTKLSDFETACADRCFAKFYNTGEYVVKESQRLGKIIHEQRRKENEWAWTTTIAGGLAAVGAIAGVVVGLDRLIP